MIHSKILAQCYRHRFSSREYKLRQSLWNTICKESLQKYINPRDRVMDIGAGYCEFLHAVTCFKKIAVDLNPDTKKFAGRGITVLSTSVKDIPSIYFGKVDVIFMSNFLEHLPSKEHIFEVLNIAQRLLNEGGRIIILQPNIALTKESYWDFIDHHIAVTDKSIVEVLELCGFVIQVVVKRFLPYTTKSKIPVHPWLARLYLRIPQILRPFAGQSLFVATKDNV